MCVWGWGRVCMCVHLWNCVCVYHLNWVSWTGWTNSPTELDPVSAGEWLIERGGVCVCVCSTHMHLHFSACLCLRVYVYSFICVCEFVSICFYMCVYLWFVCVCVCCRGGSSFPKDTHLLNIGESKHLLHVLSCIFSSLALWERERETQNKHLERGTANKLPLPRVCACIWKCVCACVCVLKDIPSQSHIISSLEGAC